MSPVFIMIYIRSSEQPQFKTKLCVNFNLYDLYKV